jgi:hypothetical protein
VTRYCGVRGEFHNTPNINLVPRLPCIATTHAACRGNARQAGYKIDVWCVVKFILNRGKVEKKHHSLNFAPLLQRLSNRAVLNRLIENRL